MALLYNALLLFYTFFQIGIMGFGGGYAMLAMIVDASLRQGITPEQIANLMALDMVVPGPISINAATYVGYLRAEFWGSLAATVGVIVPSFIVVSLVMHYIVKYRNNTIMQGVLSGVKPAAVGLVASAALTIAIDVILREGMNTSMLFTNPVGAISFLMLGIFVITAVANIRFKVNPILLTVLAGVVGAVASMLNWI